MMKNNRGFTLLEVLIALFIFTIVSMLMMGALHSVINTSSRTELHAEKLAELQMGFLVLSTDVENTVNRSVRNAHNVELSAVTGDVENLWISHAAVESGRDFKPTSVLHRTHYYFKNHELLRNTSSTLDEVKQKEVSGKKIMSDLSRVKFEFLDAKNKFQTAWPLPGQDKSLLPKAIKITVSINELGTVSQLYVIPIETKQIPPVINPTS